MSRTTDHERVIAQLITSSIKGRRWRELTPLDISKHLVENGVRFVVDTDRHDAAEVAR